MAIGGQGAGHDAATPKCIDPRRQQRAESADLNLEIGGGTGWFRIVPSATLSGETEWPSDTLSNTAEYGPLMKSASVSYAVWAIDSSAMSSKTAARVAGSASRNSVESTKST